MTEIYVDADACPVKDEVIKVAARHGLVVHMVSNGGIRPSPSPLVRAVVVPEGADVADDWIAERAGATDICITADVPLAARCVAVGAKVLGPTGKPFTPDNMGMSLAMRDLATELRDQAHARGETGGGGNRAFSKQHRSRFLSALEDACRATLRDASG